MKFGKFTKKLRVPEGVSVDLSKWKTRVAPLYESDEDYEKHLGEFQEALRDFQEKLFAAAEYAVLIIFQGMDTSGKDGAIAHVMSGVNPQGCFVHSFKVPSEDELKHDFLWRTHFHTPMRGEIGIFNRSYYEEVLVDRVHPEVLAKERLPRECQDLGHFWQKRLQDIRHHETYLVRQGIKIVKIFLHLSKAEQRERLVGRIEKPKKNWKISIGDFSERRYWKQYIQAYEHAFEETSTKECPWFIVPADDKKNARILISQILTDELKEIPVRYPEITPEQKRVLQKMKKMI